MYAVLQHSTAAATAGDCVYLTGLINDNSANEEQRVGPACSEPTVHCTYIHCSGQCVGDVINITFLQRNGQVSWNNCFSNLLIAWSEG